MVLFFLVFFHILTDWTPGRDNWSQITETLDLEAKLTKYTLKCPKF